MSIPVVILAGGMGTRMGTVLGDSIPKPMIPVNGKPLIWYILNHYSSYGFNEFIICCGFRQEYIKDYFYNYKVRNSDVIINLNNGDVEFNNSKAEKWKIILADTGLTTLTSERIKKVEAYINKRTFMVTYGDGISNININELLNYHYSHGKIGTITSVKVPGRFGSLKIDSGKVINFEEKMSSSVNGGFMVFNPQALEYMDAEMLEKTTLPLLSNKGELMAYEFNGNWHCADTPHEIGIMSDLIKGEAFWKK